MARWFSIRPALRIKGRKFKGLRGFAGKPFHPPLTDIPVAGYFLGGVFMTIGYYSDGDLAHNMFVAATYSLLAGWIVSIPTILTGLWDWWKSTTKHTQAWRTANWHMVVMLFTTTLVLLTLKEIKEAWGGGVPTASITLLSILVALFVSFGALYGGALVYEYGFNVETAGDHPAWHESEEDVFPGADPAAAE